MAAFSSIAADYFPYQTITDERNDETTYDYVHNLKIIL